MKAASFMSSSIACDETAQHQWLGNITLDGENGDFQTLCDCGLRQTIELRQQEGLAHEYGEAIQHAIDLDQGFERGCAGFRRNLLCLWQCRERFQIRLLNDAPPVEIGDDTLRNGDQQCARVADGFRQVVGQHGDKGVVRKIGGVKGLSQFFAQSSLQPMVMVAIKEVHFLVNRCLRSWPGQHAKYKI